MRYKFFREHKFVSFLLNDLERFIAKTDFRVSSEVAIVIEKFNSAKDMLHSHAEYENDKLFVLLKSKDSPLVEDLKEDHVYLDKQLASLQTLLDQVLVCDEEEKLAELGHSFYLEYRKLVGENLLHLHE